MEQEEYKQHIAKRIRKFRLAQNLSQYDFATALGVHVTQVSRWESGRSSVNAFNAYWIAKVLQIPMQRIFGD